jgi:hypothetical protein
MSSTLLTEEGEPEVRTAEELLKENRMKDMALSKASNLIELLNIEVPLPACSWKSNAIAVSRP